MILGTLGAGYFGYNYGMVAGIVGAIAFGAIGGVLHAVATVLFGVDHIVSGVAINIIAAGLAAFLAETWFTDAPGGGPTQSPPLPSVPDDHDRAARRLRQRDARTSTGSWSPTSSRPVRRAGRPDVAARPWSRWRSSRSPRACCGRRRSACGSGPAARPPRPRSRSASTSTATSSSPSPSRAAWPASRVRYLAMVSSSGYQNGRPTDWATSAWPR